MKTSTLIAIIVAIAALFVVVSKVYGATTPPLGVATSYSVFGNAGVTNTGPSHVWGDVGQNGFGDSTIAGKLSGTLYTIAQPIVASAVGTAYGALDAQGATGALDLAGTHTVTPGVYTVGATTLNGMLTLNGAGVYIFRSDSSITTSGGGSVSLTNGATACNVFWQIPTSMTIGTGSHIEGTIITDTGLVSLATGASLKGRALAHTQVTLDNNQITEPTCDVPSSDTSTTTPPSNNSNNSTGGQCAYGFDFKTNHCFYTPATTTPAVATTTHAIATTTPVVATTTPVVATTTATTTIAKATATSTNVLPLKNLPYTGLSVGDWLYSLRYTLIISAVIALGFSYVMLGFVL